MRTPSALPRPLSQFGRWVPPKKKCDFRRGRQGGSGSPHSAPYSHSAVTQPRTPPHPSSPCSPAGPCGHDFCKTCLEDWREVSPSSTVRCPMCRQNILPSGLQSLGGCLLQQCWLGVQRLPRHGHTHRCRPVAGVCMRLKNTIEQLYPSQSAERRQDVSRRGEGEWVHAAGVRV